MKTEGRARLKPFVWGVTGLIVVAASAAAIWVFPMTGSIGARQPDAAAPAERAGLRRTSGRMPVEVVEARSSKTTTDIFAIGSLQSDESVVLAPEVSGRVAEILFDEGRPVKKGAALVKLDDSLVAAEVADAKARLTLADANYDRARALVKSGSVTGRGRDEAQSNFETAQAALALAETKLSKMVLRAPFDGVAGTRSISVGAFVNTGAPVTNIEKIDALKVDFKVPETNLPRIKVGQKIEVRVDAVPGRTYPAEIYAINPLIDVNGRALQVRARLDNSDLSLRPGLFARILIKGLDARDVVVVPESAVVPRGGDTFVFAVEGGKAVERRVKLGQRSSAEVEVLEGLEPSERVVVAGQQRLRNGVDVEIIATPQARSQPGAGSGLQKPSAARRG